MGKPASFQRFNLGTPAPRCPLCVNNANAPAGEHFMERHFVEDRGLLVFKCDRYKVAIRVDDPFVGKWEAALERAGGTEDTPGKIPCPRCHEAMRYFATSVGYMKAVCPMRGCGVTMSAGESNRKPLEQSLPEAAARGDGDAGIDKVYTPEKPGSVQ